MRSRTAQWRQGWALRWPRPFGAGAHLRVLLVSMDNPISQSQVFPFYLFSHQWPQRIQLREVNLDRFLAAPDHAPQGADVVLLQTWIDKSPEQLVALVGLLRELNPNAKVVYLDSFAPTDLRFAAALNDCVDLYVKKHVLRDRTQYARPTAGETNLTDFYSRHYGIAEPERVSAIPPSFFSKLIVGPTFFLAPYLVHRFHGHWTGQGLATRRYELHARLGGIGQSDWYQRMRSDAQAAVTALPSLKTTPVSYLSKRAYLAELGQCATCFSPFGYGEVCWRDYEAVAMGAVLIKPDMSHIETAPDIFVPHQTYVPISWTFEDLGAAVARVLDHPAEAERISRAAFDVLATYCREGGFRQHMNQVLAT
ncbi:MAG: glycosyltransferase [Burkholderiales bacterium]